MPSFTHTLRYVTAIIAILFAVGFALGMAFSLFQYLNYWNYNLVSFALTLGFFAVLSGSIGWWAHPS